MRRSIDRRPPRSTRSWIGLIVVVLVLVAGVVAAAVSVRQLQDLEERQEVADAAGYRARLSEARLDARAADMEALIDDLDLARDAHLARADTIDTAVADIVHLRAKVVSLTKDLLAGRADRNARQAQIDLLLGCRDDLTTAITQLSGDHTSALGATGALEQGRARCQAAMDQVQGDTGAVHPYDFADPSVLLVGDTYYAYATEGPGGAIQVLSSKDLSSWSVRTRALSNRPAWAKPGPIWAPSVHPIGGRFVLYYATRSKVSGQQCISTAVSEGPAGPFLDDTTVPMVCQDERGGSIDPDVYLDDFGFAHLTWKSEDETVGGVAHLWTQFLDRDGRSVVGLPKELLRAEDGWERKTIENPSMVRVDGTWILLYSGNKWNTDGYTIGYAICESATGPCRRPASPKIRASGRTMQGPGGADAFPTRGGQMGVVFAAWDAGKVGNPYPRRLHVATIAFHDGALWWRDR